MKIAEKHGGRAYSTGLYFAGKVFRVYGRKRSENLKRFKKEVDPERLMNPGRVLDRTFVSRSIGHAGASELIARLMGNRIHVPIDERMNGSLRGFPGFMRKER